MTGGTQLGKTEHSLKTNSTTKLTLNTNLKSESLARKRVPQEKNLPLLRH